MIAGLAIRSIALSALALFVAWYALLGGRAALEDALPEISGFAPPAIVAARVGLGDPLRWLVGFAMLFAALVFLAVVQRFRRKERGAVPRTRSLAEERLWAEHLAWLEQRKRPRVHARLAGARYVGGVNVLPDTEKVS